MFDMVGALRGWVPYGVGASRGEVILPRLDDALAGVKQIVPRGRAGVPGCSNGFW